jgi:hypothetical protein
MTIAAVGIIVADSLAVYGAVALLFSTSAVRTGYLALRRQIDRACGTLMVAFGTGLILGKA